MKSLRSSQLLAIIFALLFAVGFAILMLQLRPDKVKVVVPTKNIPQFQAINTETDFKTVEVEKADVEEIDANEVTVDWLNDLIKESDGGILYSRVNLKTDERLDRRNLSASKVGSLALVNDTNEQVVTVSVSPIGTAAGTIQAGSVVDILPGDTNTISNVKVLAFGPIDLINASVLGGTPPAEAGGELAALIAVPRDIALSLSGQSVTMSLSVFCMMDEKGNIVPVEREGAEGADCGQGEAGAEGNEDAPAADATDEASQ